MAIANGQTVIDSQLSNRQQSIMMPPPMIGLPKTPEEREAWKAASVAGHRSLEAGTIGILLVAGGAGTRLGFPHPKGMYPIGPVTDRSLFQLFAEQVLALSNRYGRAVPFLIMTSEQTHQEISEYFRVQNWFGIDPADVFLFPQGSQPVVDVDSGQPLLGEQSSKITSPDGHGGALAAMERAGLYSELRWRGIETLFYHQVDNPLVHICDPVFIGFHTLHNSDVSTKAVSKKSTEEKAGVIVEMDGHLQVIEYTELPTQHAVEREASGELRWSAANTAIHLFQLDFLERIAEDPNGLPWHCVQRRVSYADANGQLVKPNYANAIKCERFIFDVLPKAQRAIIVETDRAIEFAPLKNADGDCSPAAVRHAMSNAAAARLRLTGISPLEGSQVEIYAGALLDEPIRLRPDFLGQSHPPIVIRKEDLYSAAKSDAAR
jgi:UDP-N-acetylglucosamine/UDP-N-acetylgalactosamine diphosphorylase